MGQMTTAVILGVNAGEAPKSLVEGWHSLFERYKEGNGPRPDYPSGDTEDHNVIGFWVAVGGSGEDGCPHLGKGFPLSGFLDVPEYAKAYAKAEKAWARFAAFAIKEGFAFAKETPRLWLVQTEVA